MNTILKQLAAVGTPRHRWAEYRDIIRASDGIEDANRSGFTVIMSTGRERVDVPGGLTEDFYNSLAELCDDDEKGLLAKGVIDNLLRADWNTWDSFQGYFCKELGQSLEEWLADVVAPHGCETIASLLRDAISQYRIEFPRAGTLPSWDKNTMTLKFGSYGPWRLTSRANCQIAVMSALQANNWKPVNQVPEWESPKDLLRRKRSPNHPAPGFLDTAQIKFALYELRKLTSGVLDWHELNATGAAWNPLV